MTDNSASNSFRPLLPRPPPTTSTFAIVAPNTRPSTLSPKRSAVKAACEACRRRKAKVCDLCYTNHHKINSPAELTSAMANDPVAVHVSKVVENASTERPHQNREMQLSLANMVNSSENSTRFRVRTTSSISFSKPYNLDRKPKLPQYSNESEVERIVNPSCGTSVSVIFSFNFT